MRYSRNPDALHRSTVRGVLVLPPGRDEPQLITAPGDRVWEELARPRTLDDLAATLAAQFEAEPTLVANDVSALLDQLIQLGVVVAD